MSLYEDEKDIAEVEHAAAKSAKRRNSAVQKERGEKAEDLMSNLDIVGGQETPAYSLVDGMIDSAANLCLPMRLRFQPDRFLSTDTLSQPVQSLAKQFLTSVERVTPGRGHRALSELSGIEAIKLLHGMFPPGFMIGDGAVKPEVPPPL